MHNGYTSYGREGAKVFRDINYERMYLSSMYTLYMSFWDTDINRNNYSPELLSNLVRIRHHEINVL